MDPISPPSHVVKKRWAIAFSAALMNALQSGAFFFTPTTLMPQIVSDLALPLSLSTVPIAVGKISYVLLLIPGGIMVDRHGPRICVIFGIIGLAILMTLYAIFVSSFSMLLCVHILLAIFASVSGVPVYSIFIAQWFDGGIGLAMGLVLAGYSAAGTTIPAFLGVLASAFGWRVAMACMCALLWFLALPVSYFLLHETQAANAERDAARDASIDTVQQSENTPLVAQQLQQELPMADHKSWTFVGFAFSYILLQYCFGCFGENVMFFLTIDRGMTLGMASLFFSLLNLSSFSAKVIGGHLGDRFDRFYVASAASGLAALGIVFLFLGSQGLDEDHIPYLTQSSIAMLLFTMLFGFGYGATFNCLYALVPIVFGRRDLGRTQSTLFGLGLAGNAVGSVLTGVLRSEYGTYQRPFLVAAVACLANFFVFNVTRLTLGGSIEGLKELNTEQESIALSEPYSGMEELEAREEALLQRIGEGSDSGTEPRMSPLNSLTNLNPYLFSNDRTRLPVSRSAHALPNREGGYRTISDQLYTLRRSVSRHSGTGMVPDHGYPIPRDWSNPSLKLYQRTSSDVEVGGLPSSPIPQGGLRRSSTFEAMVESGILSASLEAVGYVGTRDRPASLHASADGLEHR